MNNNPISSWVGGAQAKSFRLGANSSLR